MGTPKANSGEHSTGCALRRSHAAPEPRTITAEKPQAHASASLITPTSTLRCLESFEIVAHLQERIAKRQDVIEQSGRQILMYAANAKVVGMHACAGSAFIEYHELFALFKAP